MSNPVHAKPKIQLTPEAVAGSLLIPQPAQTSMDIGRKEEMFPGLFINVSVAEIDFFDKNPCTRHDPELYRQIKESVRESGIQQPVHITRRPGSSQFTLPAVRAAAVFCCRRAVIRGSKSCRNCWRKPAMRGLPKFRPSTPNTLRKRTFKSPT